MDYGNKPKHQPHTQPASVFEYLLEFDDPFFNQLPIWLANDITDLALKAAKEDANDLAKSLPNTTLATVPDSARDGAASSFDVHAFMVENCEHGVIRASCPRCALGLIPVLGPAGFDSYTYHLVELLDSLCGPVVRKGGSRG